MKANLARLERTRAWIQPSLTSFLLLLHYDLPMIRFERFWPANVVILTKILTSRTTKDEAGATCITAISESKGKRSLGNQGVLIT